MPRRSGTSYIKSILKHLKFGKKPFSKTKILILLLSPLLFIALALLGKKEQKSEEDEPIGWC